MLVLDSKQFPHVIKNAKLYFIDIHIVTMNYPFSIFVPNLPQDYLRHIGRN